MKYIACVILGFLLFVQYTDGQVPSVYIGHESSQINLIYGNSTLASSDLAEFLSSDKKSVAFDPAQNVYWTQVKLINKTDRDDEWILDCQNWSYADAYILDSLDGASYVHKRTGHLLNYHDRDYPFANKSYILVDVPRDRSVDLVLRLEATPNNYLRPQSLGIKAVPRAQLDNVMRKDERIMWMFLSVYMILFFYNLFFLLSIRDISYVFYLIRVACVTYLIANNSGFIMPLFSGLDGFAQYKSYIESFVSGLNWMCLLLFTITFFQTKKNLPKLHKVLVGGIIGIFILVIGAFTRHPIFLTFSILYLYLLMIIIIVVAITALIKRIPSSQYYVLAYTFSVIGVIVMSLVYARVIEPTGFFTHYPQQLGYGLELLFFSFALADKINVLEKKNEEQKLMIINQLKEKEQLQADINKDLENKVRERTREIEKEKDKSDQLLLNILPKSTAEELKKYGHTKPNYHENVSIMLTDFINFTLISSELDPEQLVSELDDIFKNFDDIIEKNKLEKIKTIGDAYMVAGGLHNDKENHVHRMIQCAKDIFDYLDERNKISPLKWNIRIGLHTGPVVSGVVGKKKFTFDTWGDTVNIASRLEQAGEPNKLNVSQRIYEMASDKYQFESRGELEVKGKGKMKMFFVKWT